MKASQEGGDGELWFDKGLGPGGMGEDGVIGGAYTSKFEKQGSDGQGKKAEGAWKGHGTERRRR
jgi:hypothetical protein